METNEWRIETPQQMTELGAHLAGDIRRGCCMYFEGELGAGKTTLIRGMIQALGVDDNIPSPTFSIMETYSTGDEIEILHIDLYRIEDPQELVMIGLDEFNRQDYAWFIEWPDKGGEVIPAADHRILLRHAGEARIVELINTGV